MVTLQSTIETIFLSALELSGLRSCYFIYSVSEFYSIGSMSYINYVSIKV